MLENQVNADRNSRDLKGIGMLTPIPRSFTYTLISSIFDSSLSVWSVFSPSMPEMMAVCLRGLARLIRLVCSRSRIARRGSSNCFTTTGTPLSTQSEVFAIATHTYAHSDI